MNKKISFQGVEGAYSHLAVQEFFPGADPLPCKTFEIALNEAELGNVDYAMIPIENSAAGRVADIHRLIPKSNLHINFEHFQKTCLNKTTFFSKNNIRRILCSTFWQIKKGNEH